MTDSRKFIESKYNLLGKLLPFLSDADSSGKKPKIYFSEGLSGVRNTFLDNLNATGELLTIAGERTFNDFIIKEYPNYIQERVSKKILLKLIVPDSERMHSWKSLDKDELRVTKLVTNNLYPLNINIDVYNDKVTLTSFENLIALTIESEDIANSMRSVFYLIWDNLRESEEGSRIFDTTATHFTK